MRYSVLMEPVNEAEFEGFCYAHVPSLDLTAHGKGIEGALQAVQELVEAWVAEKRAHGEVIPTQRQSIIAQIDVADVAMDPKTLPTGTFRRLLKQAGLSEEAFRLL